MSVSILMVRALIDGVERAGVPRDRLLAAAGLEAARLDDSRERLTLAGYDRVQVAALELSGDPALGLHLAERSDSHVFDLLGHLTVQAGTLREAIEGILRYSRLLSVGPAATLHEQGEVASVRFDFPRFDSPSIRLPSELALTGLMRLLRIFVGPDAQPRAVCFAYAAPAYRAEYARVFGGVERFGQPFTGLELDRAWLERTQLHTNPELYSLLEAQAERALGRLARDSALVANVLERLGAADPRQPPAMDAVARELGMSARSLRRKLATEGTTYPHLFERARTRMAMRMLEDPQSSIQEVAFAMGFATPAAFHRAFKRWTGKTPKQYKETY